MTHSLWNPSPIDLLHQISIQVKQTNELVPQNDEVDNVLLGKLFPRKKRPASFPITHGSYKKAKLNQDGPIDTNLMATLGFAVPQKPEPIIDEEAPSPSSACTPSLGPTNGVPGCPLSNPEADFQSFQEKERIKKISFQEALNRVLDSPNLVLDDLIELKKEAKEASITRDRAMMKFYSKQYKKLMI